MGICFGCSKYRLREHFTETQWQKPRQKDRNVPRSCIECLEKGTVDVGLNWSSIADPNPQDVLEFEKRPPRPEKVRTGRMLDTILDRDPDIDFAETQEKRDAELDYLWTARKSRAETRKRKRIEKGGK